MRLARETRPQRSAIDSEGYDGPFLLGTFRSLLLGHSSRSEVRGRGASGGVTTELLTSLLEQGEVQGVIAAGFDPKAPLAPCYLLKTDPAGVRTLAGSIYCFMEIQQLRAVMEQAGGVPLAVVVQPCHVKVVRKWQRELFPNIKIIISFFCGYNMTPDAISYLLAKSKTGPEEVKNIRFRGGPYPGGFTVERKDGSTVCFGKECYELANLMFLREGCSRCSLYMGEGADIAMGDAWIREHPRHSAIVCRTSKGEEALRAAASNGLLEVFTLPEKDLIRMHYHNLVYKKYGHSLPMRLLVILFRKVLPRSLVPFYLLTRLSYYRRKFKIGISMPVINKVTSEVSEGKTA